MRLSLLFSVLMGCVFILGAEATAEEDKGEAPKSAVDVTGNVGGRGSEGNGVGLGGDAWWNDAFEESFHNAENPPPSHGGGVNHVPGDPNYIAPPWHVEGDAVNPNPVANGTSQGMQGGLEGIIGSDTAATSFLSLGKLRKMKPARAAFGRKGFHEIFSRYSPVPHEGGDPMPPAGNPMPPPAANPQNAPNTPQAGDGSATGELYPIVTIA